MRYHLLPALTALALFTLDQLLKAYFATAARIPIVEPHFCLSNFRNTEPTTYPGCATDGMLAAGNTGNLINAWWPGYWVDYIEFPALVAFNLADVMIFGGYALVGVGVVGAAIQMRRPRYPENQSTSCPKNACKQTSKQ